jgi:hypothetical protein
MFDSLADQIRQDERGTETNTQRLVVWAAALVCVLLLFAGIYFATRLIT